MSASTSSQQGTNAKSVSPGPVGAAKRSLRNNAKGKYGEQFAVRYLQSGGFTVIDQNWRCASGEVDIVALDGAVLVICEVKTRSTDAFGGALAAVTPVKLDRLRTLALLWLDAHPIRIDSIRIDVIAVTCPPKGRARIEHVRGVS